MHICFPCFHHCRAHLITLPTHSRWFKSCLKIVVAFDTFCLFLSVFVGMHTDLTLLHSCTCVSLVAELLCALDHHSNAFALAQVASQNRVPLHSFLCFSFFFAFFMFPYFLLSFFLLRKFNCSAVQEKTVGGQASSDTSQTLFPRPDDTSTRQNDSDVTSSWMWRHTGGSRQDTHGTPVSSAVQRPWVAQPLTQHSTRAHEAQFSDGRRPNNRSGETTTRATATTLETT